jgi:hypothetical protein
LLLEKQACLYETQPRSAVLLWDRDPEKVCSGQLGPELLVEPVFRCLDLPYTLVGSDAGKDGSR